MAHFSSGTEGLDYQARYCENCVNYRDIYGIDDVPGCPIWDLHELYMDQRGGKTKLGQTIKTFLDELIPMKGIFADKCSMFTDKRTIADRESEYLEKLREGAAPIGGMPFVK